MMTKLALLAFLPAIAYAQGGASRADFENRVLVAQGHLAMLRAHREQAVKAAQALAADSKFGIELLKTYDRLLLARYVDEDGDFQAAAEISIRDRDNLNELTKVFLHATPLHGRISAHVARKNIAWALDALEDRRKAQEDPDEGNNPELEIIARQMREEKDEIERAIKLADNQGIEIDPDALAKQRSPASRR